MTKCETCGKEIEGEPYSFYDTEIELIWLFCDVDCFITWSGEKEKIKSIKQSALTLLADEGFCERMAELMRYDFDEVGKLLPWQDLKDEVRVNPSDTKSELVGGRRYWKNIIQDAIRRAAGLEGEKDG